LTNEAAQALRRQLTAGYIPKQWSALLDEALAAERKATVERIRAALEAMLVFNAKDEVQEILKLGIRHALAILDAEAAR
jgi:hypothetical protein